MERENRFSPEGLEKLRGKNYELITDLAQKLDNLKGYDTAYTNPKKGKMLINHNGQLFIVDVEPIGCMGEDTLSNAMKEYKFMFED